MAFQKGYTLNNIPIKDNVLYDIVEIYGEELKYERILFIQGRFRDRFFVVEENCNFKGLMYIFPPNNNTEYGIVKSLPQDITGYDTGHFIIVKKIKLVEKITKNYLEKTLGPLKNILTIENHNTSPKPGINSRIYSKRRESRYGTIPGITWGEHIILSAKYGNEIDNIVMNNFIKVIKDIPHIDGKDGVMYIDYIKNQLIKI